jgi:hypothetical protein
MFSLVLVRPIEMGSLANGYGSISGRILHVIVVVVFCTSKIQGGQDRAFLFWGGLVNYKAHYLLSWFRPLHGRNSPMFSDLILKMNNGYNGGEQSAQEVR